MKCENIYNAKRNIDKKQLDKIPINALGFYINYTDSANKTYCLNIYDIGSRIENNDTTNPHTGEPLPPEFIEKIKRLNETKKKQEVVVEEVPTTQVHIGHLAPGLLEIIRNDINRLVELKTSVKNIDSGPQDEYKERISYLNDEVEEVFNGDGYSSGADEYFNDDIIISKDIDNYNDSGRNEVDEDDGHHTEDEDHHNEDRDEEDEEEDEDEDEDHEDEDDGHHNKDEDDEDHHKDVDVEDKIGYGYDYDVNKEDGEHHDEDDDYTIDDTDDDSVIEMSDFEYDLDSIIPETCKHCSNDITDKKYKSILWNGKGIDNVAFCSMKCIENFDWKKYKCKIKKKKN